MWDEEARKRSQRVRSRVLLEISIILVVILVISGVVIFFLVRNSQQKLIEKSKSNVIATEFENSSSFLQYILSTLGQEVLEKSLELGWEETTKGITSGNLSGVQQFAVNRTKEIVASGALGIENFILVIMEFRGIPYEFVFASNDESLINKWEVPDYILDAIEEGLPYLYLEEGIPELDLEEEQLVVIEKLEDPNLDYVAAFMGIKPVGEEIATVNSFYGEESRSTSLTLGLVIFISILATLLIVYFVLSYLVRKRITEPIDQLASYAEEVMMGNLDVEIEVRKGGEFEGLVNAFKQMLESLRAIIEKSVEE